MSITPNSLRLPVIFCALFLSLTLFSQIRIASPYSRFGIGDLSDNNNAWNMSMGQLGIGLRSPNHVNYINPASYTAFDSLSFVFEGGFNGQFVSLSSNSQTTNRNYASLGYLLFGMPVNKWWKTSLGLIPYSDVGYNVENEASYTATGRIVRIYAGSGGINRLYWGNAFQLFKDFSVGANVSYLFGSMKREAIVMFPDSAYAMNFRENYYITMNDLYFNFGVQYRKKIKNDIFLNLGAVYAPSLSMSAKTDILANTFLVSSSTESPRDTLVNKEGSKGRIIIPMLAGGGFSFEKTDKWMVGLDYQWQNWEKFRAFDLSDSLVNSWHVSVGGEIIPNIDNYNNFLARMHYRMGFTYHKTYLRLRDQNINEYAFSVGVGIPLRGMKTMLNLGAEYGSRGNATQNLIHESFFKVVVGFSIYERWFVKHKYF
jgi:long-subunit fatty acid transport protein